MVTLSIEQVSIKNRTSEILIEAEGRISGEICLTPREEVRGDESQQADH